MFLSQSDNHEKLWARFSLPYPDVTAPALGRGHIWVQPHGSPIAHSHLVLTVEVVFTEMAAGHHPLHLPNFLRLAPILLTVGDLDLSSYGYDVFGSHWGVIKHVYRKDEFGWARRIR